MTEVVTTGAEVIATGAQYAQQTGASQYYLIYVGVAILAILCWSSNFSDDYWSSSLCLFAK